MAAGRDSKCRTNAARSPEAACITLVTAASAIRSAIGSERAALERVDDRQPVGGRNLDQAQRGSIRTLPHEFGVDGAAPLTSGFLHQRRYLLWIGDPLNLRERHWR